MRNTIHSWHIRQYRFLGLGHDVSLGDRPPFSPVYPFAQLLPHHSFYAYTMLDFMLHSGDTESLLPRGYHAHLCPSMHTPKQGWDWKYLATTKIPAPAREAPAICNPQSFTCCQPLTCIWLQKPCGSRFLWKLIEMSHFHYQTFPCLANGYDKWPKNYAWCLLGESNFKD